MARRRSASRQRLRPGIRRPGAGTGGQYAPYGAGAVARRGNTPEGAAFANWALSTDPERRCIVDAFVRDDRVLGVIINPNMTKGQVQQAMQSLLRAMQRSFPERPVEVMAYYTSGDRLARTAWDPSRQEARTVWRQ